MSIREACSSVSDEDDEGVEGSLLTFLNFETFLLDLEFDFFFDGVGLWTVLEFDRLCRREVESQREGTKGSGVRAQDGPVKRLIDLIIALDIVVRVDPLLTRAVTGAGQSATSLSLAKRLKTRTNLVS